MTFFPRNFGQVIKNFSKYFSGKQGEEGSKKDESSSKTVEKEDKSRSIKENLSCEPNQLNGLTDSIEVSESNNELKDLNPDLNEDPPYIDKRNEDIIVENKSGIKENVTRSLETAAEVCMDAT